MKLLESITSSAWAEGFRHVNCARPRCNRWLTQRHLSVRPVGLNFRDSWFCSYRCAAERIEASFGELLPSFNRPAQRNSRMPLGLILISRGCITDSQLRIAKERHAQTKEDMGDILLALGFADEEQVTAARSSLWSCPVFMPPARVPESSVAIPSALMQAYSAVPMQNGTSADKLLIGFLDRIDYGLLYAVEQITGCKTTPCFLTPTHHRAYMEAHIPSTSEISYDEAMTPQGMTRTVCEQGASVNANGLAIARCGEFVWARLSTGEKLTDLAFRIV